MERPATSEVFEGLLRVLADAVSRAYGERLVSLVVFGSVGRGVPRPDSDMDVLVVADPLADGRMRRVDEFSALVEPALDPVLKAAAAAGVHTDVSPVLKTRAEVLAGSPLFLDLVDDARILIDKDDFFAKYLGGLRERLRALGARRIWVGSAWYWDLKPDMRPGEVIAL